MDSADLEAGGITPRTRREAVASGARAKVKGRRLEAQYRMRPHLVVFLAKPGERPPEARQRRRDSDPAQALGERAVKALDLALGLRVADRTNHQADPLLQEKDA